MNGNYYTLPILAFLGVLYVVTYLLQKRNVITIFGHRKIWNLILTISFLLSAISGIVMALVYDSGILFDWYAEFLQIHVETGIIMATAGLFHALWHIAYYKAILFKKK